MTRNTVTLTDFLGVDVLDTFRKAASYCREHPHTTLLIPPGRYIVRDEAAAQLMENAMQGRLGANPQEQIFIHYFPYARGLDLSGCEDVTVEGYGAWLVCDGWMEPVTIENCRNVTLRGLTIDYLRKPYSIGTVIAETGSSYDVRFDAKYPVNSSMPSPRIYQYHWDKARFSSEGWDCETKEQLAPQVIRFIGEKPQSLLNATLCVWHSFHFRPAIFLNESINTTLHEVTIHSQPGMGIVGHRCENIRAQGLRIVPEAGEVMSTNTDATHFTSCKGELRFEGCHFEGHGDDALNVHNYYYSIVGGGSHTCDILVEEADAHAQVLDYPDFGDELELVNAATLETVQHYRVAAVKPSPKDWKATVTLNGVLPQDCSGLYLVNTTRLPQLSFIGCHVRNHLARAVLIKTRNVLVEGCTFEDSMGTAIHIAAEGGWREGVPAAHVQIRHNRMLRCGHGNQGRIMGASAICVNIDADRTDTAGLHHDLLFENNIVVGENAQQGFYISCARDVMVRNNEFSGCITPVEVLHCTDVTVIDNHIRS